MKLMSRRALLAIACGLVLAGLAMGIAPRILVSAARQVAHAAARTAARTVDLAASPARAEDMKFEPLSAESLSTLDRRRSRRTTTASGTASRPPAVPAVPVVPAVPAVPGVPAVPEAPDAPSVIIGKSGDIMRVGSDVTVGKDDVVTGDVLAVGGDLTIEGHVEGNAVAMGGDIYLQPSARVDGDVVCMGGELHEETGAVVGGKRVVGLGKNSHIGRKYSRDFDIDVQPDRHRSENKLASSMAWLLIWLMIGWAIVKITPGRTAAALEAYRNGPGASFLVGWLALVLTVPGLIAVALLTALLCITIIGIPLGIAVLFGYFLFLAVFVVWGSVVGAAVIGERLAVRQGFPSPTLMRATVTGLLVLNGGLLAARLLQFVPLFGGIGKFAWVILLIANILIAVAGWGALLRSEFTTGLIARWWHGRRGGPASPSAPPPYDPAPIPPATGGSGTSVTTVAVPQAPVAAAPPHSFASPLPPSPASSFAPPASPSSFASPPPSPPSSFASPPPSPPSAFAPPPEGTPPASTPGS